MLNGKTALVTGGSRGIGRAICLELARQGAKVALVYAGNEEAAGEALARLAEAGAQAKAYRCDVADFAATEELVKAVTADFGGIDILVNNAGVNRDKLCLRMTEEDFDVVLQSNSFCVPLYKIPIGRFQLIGKPRRNKKYFQILINLDIIKK